MALSTFLYDDCCPLCRTYTATFSALGWADRAPFSEVSDDTLGQLDLDRARHQIPLVDAANRTTSYGLDGILDVVTENAPVLGSIGRHRRVRPVLDGFYYLITYNRRHIVASPPPAHGLDCAPDHEPRAIKSYLALAGAAVALLGRSAPAAVVTATTAATVLVTNRQRSWAIEPLAAAGHVATVGVAAAGAASIAGAARAGLAVRTTAALAVGARKVYLRRWIALGRPNPESP